MSVEELPFIDERSTSITAEVGVVWPAIMATLERAAGRSAMANYVRVIGGREQAASGPRPLDVGSTMPGFRVVAVKRPSQLTLEGHHRFATYALIFRLDRVGAGSTVLRAETRAAFHGAGGRAYRMLLLRSGQHVAAVNRLLSDAERRSERPPDANHASRRADESAPG